MRTGTLRSANPNNRVLALIRIYLGLRKRLLFIPCYMNRKLSNFFTHVFLLQGKVRDSYPQYKLSLFSLFSLFSAPEELTQLMSTGYPDLASKMFLSAVSSVQREKGLLIPIFILTDADPHGIHIAFCYIRDLPNCNVRWIGVRPSDNGSLIQIRESALLPVTSAEITLADGMLRHIACCETKEAESFAPLAAELNLLKATGNKFEIEALTCTGLGEDMSGLLRYLLSRT